MKHVIRRLIAGTLLAVTATASLSAAVWNWSCCDHGAAYQRVKFNIEGNGWLTIPADMRTFKAANLPDGSLLLVQWSDDGVKWYGCDHEINGFAKIIAGKDGCDLCAHTPNYVEVVNSHAENIIGVEDIYYEELVLDRTSDDGTDADTADSAGLSEISAPSDEASPEQENQSPEPEVLDGDVEVGSGKDASAAVAPDSPSDGRKKRFTRDSQGLHGLFFADGGYGMRITRLFATPSINAAVTPQKAEAVQPDAISLRFGTELLYGAGALRAGGRVGLRLSLQPSPVAGSIADVFGSGAEVSLSPYAGVVVGFEVWRIRLAVGADIGWSMLTRAESDNAHTMGTVDVFGLPFSTAWTLGGDVSLSLWLTQKFAVNASAGLVRYFPSGYAIGEVRTGVTFTL